MNSTSIKRHVESFPAGKVVNTCAITGAKQPNTVSSFRSTRKVNANGFTLIEILTVLSIVSILSILVSTGFQTVAGRAYDGETSDIASTLIRARAYAMANNTYVFVGIQEVDASKAANATQTSGNGRIGITVVASNDGTRGYLTSISTSTPLTSSSLTVVSPLRHYDNVHISSSSSISNLPNASAGTSYNVASTTASSLTTFTWPLTGTAQYSFGNNANSPGTVIQFNPQGEAQIVTGPNTDSILQWIEIDLAPTHGNQVPGTPRNPATILIDGASGSVTIFRT